MKNRTAVNQHLERVYRARELYTTVTGLRGS